MANFYKATLTHNLHSKQSASGDNELGFFVEVVVFELNASTCTPLVPGWESFSNILESKEKCVSCACMPP